jgi:hypothetical protein
MSIKRRRSQLGHLLADDSHLLAIVRVLREAPNLLAYRGSDSPARRCFPQ